MVNNDNASLMIWKCFSIVVAFVVAVTGSSVFSADDISPNNLLGVWKEKDGGAIYSFMKEHEFEFYFMPTDQTKYQGARHKGVWRMGPGICWVGEMKGNLMIHVGTDRCCFLAQILGKNLVLSIIGIGRSYSVCSDRVLVREVIPPKR